MVAAAVTAMVVAASAAAAGPTVIPFPAPPAGPTVGRFHTLPSLQCRLHPTAPGGASPDPAAVADPARRGGTGWVLNTTAADGVIPYRGGTCASPLNDDFQLAYLAQPKRMAKRWQLADGGPAASTADAGADFSWAAAAFYARMSTRAQQGRWSVVAAGHRGTEYFRPHPCAAAAAAAPTGLVCEAQVARLLALQRNQLHGLVQRQRGLYDVLSVGRASKGVALDADGRVVAAMDRVSGSSDVEGANQPYPIVMYAGRDGRRRPVLSGEAALLTLGRGVMADPSWLGDSFPGGLDVNVKLFVRHGGVRQPAKTWALRHGAPATNSSHWLQAVANTLCTAPSSSFVAGSRFCDGMPPPKASGRPPLRAGGRPVAGSLSFAAGQYQGVSEMTVRWTIWRGPTASTADPCPPRLDNVTFSSVNVKQPLWLLGRGDRELHATERDGGTEVELARRLSSCTFNRTRADLDGFRHVFDDEALAADLSQRYRRDIFRVDPPAEPISNTELFLTLVVVVPEGIAIVLVLLQRRGRQQPPRASRWYWREATAMALVVAAGAVALLGVGYLDQQERRGAAWRAAAIRHSRRLTVREAEAIARGAGGINYRGRVTTDNETLLVVARTGYRPGLTCRLLVAATVAYAALTAAALARAAAAAWRRRRRWQPSAAGGCSDGGGAAHAKPPRPRRRWWPWSRRAAAVEPPVTGAGGGGTRASPPVIW